MDGLRTQKMLSSIASLHIMTGHQSRFLRVQGKVPTSKSFQIWCKGTTNEEANGEKLLHDEV